MTTDELASKVVKLHQDVQDFKRRYAKELRELTDRQSKLSNALLNRMRKR